MNYFPEQKQVGKLSFTYERFLCKITTIFIKFSRILLYIMVYITAADFMILERT